MGFLPLLGENSWIVLVAVVLMISLKIVGDVIRALIAQRILRELDEGEVRIGGIAAAKKKKDLGGETPSEEKGFDTILKEREKAASQV